VTFKVGLTGGIGSGKTTVAAAFSELGVPTFSADAIGHELSQPGEAGYEEIVNAFGTGILNEDRSLNRTRLGDIVFNDPALKAQLENILHPLIMQRMHQRADACQAPYCILDIPLLVQTPEQDKVSRILVVTCDHDTRVARIKSRNHWPEDKIAAVIAAQLPQSVLIQSADDVILNDGTIKALTREVGSLHRYYIDLIHPDTK